MTIRDKSLINTCFLEFSMKELRKAFPNDDLRKIDQRYLLTCITNGATLIDLKVLVKAIVGTGKLMKTPTV